MSSSQRHTFSDSKERPSAMQRDLDPYDRDTIAYLAMLGLEDHMIERVLKFGGKR